MNQEIEIIGVGTRVILRDPHPEDVDYFFHAQLTGQWRKFDAPWEGVLISLSPREEENYRSKFLERLRKEKPFPRDNAVISTQEGKPIGNVNRYSQPGREQAWFIGIDIFDDEYLNRGMGTEALQLWIDYLFANSTIHRIGLDTWSFNPRMVRVAYKLGFTYEGAQREMQVWQGEWLDLLHFSLLRSEWEEKKAE